LVIKDWWFNLKPGFKFNTNPGLGNLGILFCTRKNTGIRHKVGPALGRSFSSPTFGNQTVLHPRGLFLGTPFLCHKGAPFYINGLRVYRNLGHIRFTGNFVGLTGGPPKTGYRPNFPVTTGCCLSRPKIFWRKNFGLFPRFWGVGTIWSRFRLNL